MTRVIDPESAHLAALRRQAGFHGKAVLEVGCGDGRLTLGIAAEAAHVVAFDPDAEAVGRARAALPAELADRVAFHAASGTAIHVPRVAFDLVVFSWSL